MARKTLSQKIELSGGKEIEAELKAIGAAGELAFERIGDGVKAAAAPLAKLQGIMPRINASFERLRGAGKKAADSLSAIGQQATRLRASLATVARRMTLLTTAALGAAAAIAAVARSGARAVDQAAKTAEGLGLSIEQYSRLEFVASQAGVSTEQFGSALNSLNTKVAAATKVQTKLGDQIGLHPEQWAAAQIAMATGAAAITKAAEGGDKATQAFKKLGVQLKIGGKVRGTRDILRDLAEAFKRLPAGIEKAGLAAAIFGEDLGRRMLPFLNLGIAGIDALERESDRIGNTLTGLQAKIAREYAVAEGKLTRSITGVKNALGLLFAPALTAAADQQTEVLVNHRKALLDLVNDAVPKAVALVEDLVAALAGRDQDVRAKWIITARDAILSFAQDVKVAWERIIRPAFEGLVRIFDQIAEGINKAFGTDFTGRQVAIAAFVGVLLGAFSSLQAVLLAVAALVVGLVPQVVPVLKKIGAALGSVFSGLKAEIPAVRALIEGFAESAKSAFKAVLSIFDTLAKAINFVFGTKLSGTEVLLGGIALKLLGIFKTISRIIVSITGLFFIVTASITIVKTALAVFLGTVTGIVTGLGLLGVTVSALLVGSILGGLLLLGAAIFIFWDDLKEGATAAWNFVADAAEEAWRRMSVGVGFLADEILKGLGKALDFIIARLKNLISLAKAAARFASNLFSSGAPASAGSGFSGGGRVAGPGSKTSDSIPARLSRGEFVIRAAAVDRYGPRLFAALNALRLPSGAIPGFSMGGLVDGITASLSSLLPAPVPAFAMGGAVASPAGGNSGRPITLVLDGQRFNLSAEDSVAEALTRTALGQQRRRAGRMPGWFGG